MCPARLLAFSLITERSGFPAHGSVIVVLWRNERSWQPVHANLPDARAAEDNAGHSEAVRQLIEAGLKAKSAKKGK
jgi:hypothetical protein